MAVCQDMKYIQETCETWFLTRASPWAPWSDSRDCRPWQPALPPPRPPLVLGNDQPHTTPPPQRKTILLRLKFPQTVANQALPNIPEDQLSSLPSFQTAPLTGNLPIKDSFCIFSLHSIKYSPSPQHPCILVHKSDKDGFSFAHLWISIINIILPWIWSCLWQT